MPSYTSPESLKARGLDIVKILTTTNDLDAIADVLSPNFEAWHDDRPGVIGRDNFLAHWKVLLQALPNLSSQVYDSLAELNAGGNAGGKVWIFSRVSGLPEGVQKDSVDMLEIDGDGRLTWIKDVQRVVEP